MGRDAEFKRRAEDAERAAQAALRPDERAAYQRIAKGWRDLEAQAIRDRTRGV